MKFLGEKWRRRHPGRHQILRHVHVTCCINVGNTGPWERQYSTTPSVQYDSLGCHENQSESSERRTYVFDFIGETLCV